MAFFHQGVGGEISLAWDPVDDNRVGGYELSYGPTSDTSNPTIDTGNTTEFTVPYLNANSLYFFRVRAYSQDRTLWSEFSNEVSSRAILRVSAPTPKVETGVIDLDHEWTSVELQQTFYDPVVVIKALSGNGSDPATVRVDRVDPTGFSVRIQEWEYLDQLHTTETVSYIVMERGTHQLSNGTWIEAGHMDVRGGSFVASGFTAPFADVPVVLSTVITFDEEDAVTTRQRKIDQYGFEVTLQEQQANPQEHIFEVVDYIAWEPSSGEFEGLVFDVRRTADEVTHSAHTLNFSTAFREPPLFLADMQSTDGGDTSNLRYYKKGSASIDVWVDEEQSKDSETAHVTETVGYVALAATPYPVTCAGASVAYWDLDDVSSSALAIDQQNTNDLTLKGAAWRPGLGKMGGALYLDGVNDFSVINDNDLSAGFPGGYGNSTQGFTLAAWIKPDRLNDRQPILSKQGTTESGVRRGFMFSAGDKHGSGKLYFEVFSNDTSGGGTSLTSSKALKMGQWQHVAVAYQYVADGSSIVTLYIDGQEVGHNSTAVGPLQSNAQALDLGRYYWSGSYQRYFKGLIDEVYAFDYALNQNEIQNLQGSGPCTIESTIASVAYWDLDASSGTVAADQQNTNDLTLKGTAWRPGLGKMDGALYLDGVNDYSMITDNDLSAGFPGSYGSSSQGFSLAAWIKPDRLNDRQPIFSKQGTTVSGVRRGFMFSAGDKHGSGKLYFEVFANDTSGGGTSLTSSQALKMGQWQHVAVAYQYVANGSSIVTLYIDGQEVGRNSTAVGPLQGNAQPLDLGRYYWSGSYQRYFKGLIDDVYVFDYALNLNEIQGLQRCE